MRLSFLLNKNEIKKKNSIYFFLFLFICVDKKKRKKDETDNRPHKYFNHNYKQDMLIFL